MSSTAPSSVAPPSITPSSGARLDRRPPLSSRDRWILGGLLFLTLVPSAAGAFRVTMLATGVEATADNLRFVDQPLPVVLHVLAVVPYSVLGAFQVVPGFRRRHRRFHRIAGRVLLPAGMMVAASGLWMTLAYDLPDVDGPRFGALGLLRLGVGAVMLVSLALATRAIVARRWREHGAWMLRAYALAMGAGTQVLTAGGLVAVVGEPTVAQRAVAMGAGWAINAALAEWLIRTRRI